MDKYGLIRVSASSPSVKPADIDFNTECIIEAFRSCASEEVDIIVFPELSVTGYTCADLFGQSILLDKAEEAIARIAAATGDMDMLTVVGAPVRAGINLYNCAVCISGGEIRAIIPKTYIPNYGEFYEKRWFSSGNDDTARYHKSVRFCGKDIPFGNDLIIDYKGIRTGVEICEDLWVANPPSSRACAAGAEIILNLSATNELIGKHRYLVELIKNQSARCRCGYVYASAGFGESSTDLAFAGNCIIARNGTIIAESRRFETGEKIEIADIDTDALRHDRMHFKTFGEFSDPGAFRIVEIEIGADRYSEKSEPMKYLQVNAHPFLDEDVEKLQERCDEISSIQAWGLATRLKAIDCRRAVVGISGGLDSTLALLVTVKAFDMLGLDRKGILGVTMPGYGTTGRTKNNAWKLMEILGVSTHEIPIGDSVALHFKDIGHDPEIRDVTYENSQARERTQILMDLANQENAILIGTGDLSELALGWCTYNGDQMSMYGVNASIPKTLVKYLVNGYAETSDDAQLKNVLQDIIETPISPELLPPDSNNEIAQKTEDFVGPYELHDFFLYQMLRFGTNPEKIAAMAVKAFRGRYDRVTICHWLRTFYRRFFSQQFKRSCMPDGIKAGSICLSPRGDWRMPSDAQARIWIDEVPEN